MSLSEVPAIVVLGAGLVLFAFLRVFRRDRRFKSGPHNNWQNEEHAALKASGNASEGTLRTSDAAAPAGYPGEG